MLHELLRPPVSILANTIAHSVVQNKRDEITRENIKSIIIPNHRNECEMETRELKEKEESNKEIVKVVNIYSSSSAAGNGGTTKKIDSIPENFFPETKKDLESYNMKALKNFATSKGIKFSKTNPKRSEIEEEIMKNYK